MLAAKAALLAAESLLKGSFSAAVRPEYEKSAVRSKVVGTFAPFSKVLVIWRKPWYEKKKKALFFTMGPPTVPPNWLRCNGGVGVTASQLFALNALLRTNSNSE